MNELGPWSSSIVYDFSRVLVFQTPLWKFLFFGGGAFILGLLAYWISRFIVYLGTIIVGKNRPSAKRAIRKAIGPMAAILGLGLLSAFAVSLDFPPMVTSFLNSVAYIVIILLGTWVFWDLIEFGCEKLDEHLQAKKDIHVSSLITLIKRSGRIALTALSFVVILDNIGFNVTSMIVGFGVGGVAIALAGQKVVENLFGGIVLILDRPVTVGDNCRFENTEGTVEEIGLRSTKIRCLDRTLLTIPNGAFAELKLENLTRRDKIRLQAILALRYETTPDQLRCVLAELRKVLMSHPKIYKVPCRARLVKFGDYSLDIEIVAFAKTAVWEEFLLIREDVFLRMMDVINTAGAGFALPSRTMYLEQGAGINPETEKKSAEQVARWRQDNECPVPQFSEKQYKAIKNSADFPPKGSVAEPWLDLEVDE